MQAPAISIIVPVYNVAPFLEDCLASVFAQTLQDFELILVDDASTDGSRDLARQLLASHPQAHLLRHSENQGPGPARNTGIGAARGEYLCFLDSDDRLAPEALDRWLHLARRCDADAVKGANLYWYEDGRLEPRRRFVQGLGYTETVPGPRVFDRLIGRERSPYIPYSPCGGIWHRRLFSDGRLRFPATYEYQEDVGLVPLLLWASQRVVLDARAHYHYRQRPGSGMRRPYDNRRITSYHALLEHVVATHAALRMPPDTLPEMGILLLNAMVNQLAYGPLAPDAAEPLGQLVARVLVETRALESPRLWGALANLRNHVPDPLHREAIAPHLATLLPPERIARFYRWFFAGPPPQPLRSRLAEAARPVLEPLRFRLVPALGAVSGRLGRLVAPRRGFAYGPGQAASGQGAHRPPR